MKTKRILSLAALALMIAACTNDDIAQQPQQPSPTAEGIPFTATISGNVATRALSENTTDKKLEASWSVNEEMALIHNGVVDKMTVSAVDADGTATITGTITGSPKDGDDVQVIYPYSAVDLTTKEIKTDLLSQQDGTLATIASKLDLRKSEGAKLKIGSTIATFDGTVSLKNQMAIVKFSLTDGSEALVADKFEIADQTGQAITTVTITASEFYVAMEPATTQTFHFTATKGDGNKYYYSKFGATLAAGKYYQSPMTLADMLHTPLTLEAVESGTIEVTIPNSLAQKIYYIINGGDKTELSGNISVNAGDKVQFFSKNDKIYYDSFDRLTIKPTKKCYVYGNVMSLIDDGTEGFANDKVIGADRALYTLFSGAANIAFHDTKDLILPATTLTYQCYYMIFNGCVGLTRLPENLLPATVLAEGCYLCMFTNCSGLTSLPENFLPATALAFNCYGGMFYGCTGLTTVPEDLLPVTALEMLCYSGMFSGCSSLEVAPTLPATTLTGACYNDMFNGCASLTTAPDLPATTLADNCYESMFMGCTKLNNVTCLATDISANECLKNWLNGAGTAEGCERIVYVDATMTGKDWQLATSGNGNDKIWTTGIYTQKVEASGGLEDYNVNSPDTW